ncbi:MAG TPA: MarR family transcriptional regulator [Candidatus Dormibacteraeota bacterium]
MAKLTGNKAEQVWEGITRAHCSMTAAIEKDMLPAGISLAWYQVLAHLRQAPDGMLRFQDLARVVGITDSGASRRLNQMIKAGLIERFLCASDRRGVYALMTDKGKATYLKAHAVFVRSLERNLKQLEPGEAELVQTALSRLSSK